LSFVFACCAAVLRLFVTCDRSHAHCRSFFHLRCCGRVQWCQRQMVDGAAQRCALLSCSCINCEHDFVRWWSGCVVEIVVVLQCCV
jgi:hypothetical protein